MAFPNQLGRVGADEPGTDVTSAQTPNETVVPVATTTVSQDLITPKAMPSILTPQNALFLGIGALLIWKFMKK